MNNGFVRKARNAQSADDLVKIAKSYNYDLPYDSAKAYFEHFSSRGELCDEELSNVVGGGCCIYVNKTAYVVVTVGLKCFVEEKDANGNYNSVFQSKNGKKKAKCGNCIYYKYDDVSLCWYCSKSHNYTGDLW